MKKIRKKREEEERKRKNNELSVTKFASQPV
jgi:hypothetical protein